MANNLKVQKFANALRQEHSDSILPSERFEVEQTLGEGAVKYKLNKSGMRYLFEAAANAKDLSRG